MKKPFVVWEQKIFDLLGLWDWQLDLTQVQENWKTYN